MILTISIPTYKRPQLLKKALSEIATQISNLTQVGIFIADDSTGEGNRAVIQEILSGYPGISLQYSVNRNNLGIDENIKNCIRAPDSEYIWLLGEDDLLTPGAIAIALDAIETYHPQFLFANYIYCDDQHNNRARSPVVPESSSASLVSFNEFAQDSIWALGFIGGCIIQKEGWCSAEVEAFSGTYYSHVGGIVNYCLDRQICLLPGILVLNRAEDVNTFTWSKDTFSVYFSFYRTLRLSKLSEKPILLEKCLRSAAKLFAVNSLVWLAAKRADGVFDAQAFELFYANNPDLPLTRRLLAKLLASFPRQPLRFLRRIHLKRRFSKRAQTS